MVISVLSAKGYAIPVAEKKLKTKPPAEWAEWVYNARNAAGLTQEQFAERISYSRGAVADWERRANNLEVAAVCRIMERFPHSPAPPIRGFSERPPVVSIVPPQPPPPPVEEVQMAQFIRAVEPKLRKDVLDAVARYIPIVLASLKTEKAAR